MENDTVQLLLKCYLKISGVSLHTLYADKDISKKRGARFRQFEGDNVRISIMMEVFLVKVKEISIAAEYYIDSFYFSAFAF